MLNLNLNLTFIRQVNGVNDGDTVFVRCVRARAPINQFKTVKATDFKFDVHVPRDSPDMIL